MLYVYIVSVLVILEQVKINENVALETSWNKISLSFFNILFYFSKHIFQVAIFLCF